MKDQKNCCVRLQADLHRLAKLKAYEKGLTLQDWIAGLILKELKKKSEH